MERPKVQKKLFYGWYLVGATWLMSFLVSATSVGIFFKPLLDAFGWSRATLSLVSSITLLVFAALSPFLGRLIDRFGARKMLLATTFAQILSSLTYAVAQSLPVVYVARFFYELKPTHSTQILTNHWFIRQRGKALGILSTGIPLGQLILSPVSQFLITTWGWRNTFYFWSGISLVLLVPLCFIIRNNPREKGLEPDGIISTGTELKSTKPGRQWAGMPMAEAMRRPGFWLLAAAHTICGITCGLMATHLVIMAVDLGYSAIIGASFLSVQGGVSLIGVLVTGVISDHFKRPKVLAITHWVRSGGLWVLVLPLLFGFNNLVVLYVSMAVFGFGWFTTSPLVAGLAADLFGNMRMGTLLGLILSSHMVGMAIGAYAGGISYQLSGNYQQIFLVTAILELIAGFLAFSIRSQREQ
jgi:predicted MFS family arabinose efflux permease